MSTISKSLLGFLFDGATVALAAAPWKNNVRALYGFSASGNGYQVFKPGNRFNSLTELVQDGSYILDAVTPSFELPGATLAVPHMGAATTWPVPGNALTNGSIQLSNVHADATQFGKNLHIEIRSTDPTDLMLLVVGEAIEGGVFPMPIPAGGTQYTLPLASSVAVGQTHAATIINRNGNVATFSFTVVANY